MYYTCICCCFVVCLFSFLWLVYCIMLFTEHLVLHQPIRIHRGHMQFFNSYLERGSCNCCILLVYYWYTIRIFLYILCILLVHSNISISKEFLYTTVHFCILLVYLCIFQGYKQNSWQTITH